MRGWYAVLWWLWAVGLLTVSAVMILVGSTSVWERVLAVIGAALLLISPLLEWGTADCRKAVKKPPARRGYRHVILGGPVGEVEERIDLDLDGEGSCASLFWQGHTNYKYLSALDDSWAALAHAPDMLAMLAEVNTQAISPEKLMARLETLGFVKEEA